MGEGEGSGGGDGGPGESSPRSGFEGAGAPRQPQCITLGRLAPRHLAVRRRRRASPPRTARRRAVREGCRWRDGWPRPNCDHAPDPRGRAVHCRGRPFRFPHRRRDLRSLRGKSVQTAFRGVLVCQGVRKSSLPGKARGFRGQDTVERHDGLSVAMEKIDQWEQENPASNGREMIDDFRLRGSRTWRRMGGPLTRGGWRTEVAHVVAHDFDNYKSALSEGEALAVVVQAVPGNPHWTRVGTDSPNPPG